ncbi:MAG: AEC family transporter [Gammaproteobacteria bacterium]|nr:MAG: AEC family transporter [Gammaproteobacteria bacterium]RKZ39589.1 MAG: AEC family transporter [Gammaproteobacteria bacterium]RKZ74020.1 MAG: AEC family transporter [Gammaproteobacteria bacterium]
MLITRICTVLFPIFTIVMIGYLYARLRSVNLAIINRFTIEVFSPALLFSVLADQSFHIIDYQPLMLAATLMVLGTGLMVLPLSYWLGINPKTLIPSMMFVNAGNMGIPVALFTFGELGLSAAMLFFIIVAILNFTLGISMVNRSAPGFSLLKLPLFQATLAGLVVSLTPINVPILLITPIKMLGACAIPMMLLSLGARLNDIDFTYWKIGLLGAILRPLSGALMFLLVRPWFTLSPLQADGLLIFAVLPPAIINYVIAEQYQQEPPKVAAIVMLGNLMSFISLPIALAFILNSSVS